MPFEVFDDGKPANLEGFPEYRGRCSLESNRFSTFEEAKHYANSWIVGFYDPTTNMTSEYSKLLEKPGDFVIISYENSKGRIIEIREYTPSCRAQQPGWVRIGIICSSNNRSLWMRIDHNNDCIEFCAGRGGDDEYIKISNSNPQFPQIANLMLAQKFAVEH